MKKPILLLSFFLLTFKIGNSQTHVYHPFPDSNAVWIFHSYFPGPNIMCSGPVEDYYSLIISGDTVIGSQTYHKLNIDAVAIISSALPCPNTKVDYLGAIREDAPNKKVYIIPPADTTEQLLYDFNLQAGDTLKGYIGTSALPYADTIDSVDSVLVGGNYRKRWKINCTSPANSHAVEIIEGIGSTYGLVKESTCNKTDLPDYSLSCFKQNDITLYPSNPNKCNIITYIHSVDENLNRIIAYPNPSDGKFTIKNDGISKEELKIEVYNILGEKVYSAYHQPIIIDLSSQPSGIYFLYVKTEIGYSPKNIFSTPQKLIITH